MSKQIQAERLAKALEGDHPAVPGARTKNEAAAELRRQASFINQLMDEVARLSKALTWEQNRAERIGTHGPGCHTWGPAHFECLLRVNQELLAALKKISKIELQMYGTDWLKITDAQTIARAAIATATKVNT